MISLYSLRRFTNTLTATVILMFVAALLLPKVNAHEDEDDHGEHTHDRPIAKLAEVMTTRSAAKVIPPTKEEDVFHFVIFGDRTGGVPAGLKVLEQAVVDTNLLDPDLVMTVGDLVQGYNETDEWLAQMTEYKDIMNRLKMSWFPVAGNHDVYWRGRGKAPAGQHEGNYEQHFGPLWYTFQHKNAGFIVLYSDEGDPSTNAKGFNEGVLQNMSDDQLEFLEKSLTELKSLDHVFVFLHHPRWIGGGYAGSNWGIVHDKLVAAGNVSAVFAGHIHHMRYDGAKDGIEYYALATTGGSLAADIPDAGFLDHVNLVTVRENRFSVAALPVGAVIDPKEFTPEFLEQVELARTIRPEWLSEPVILQPDGSANGSVILKLTNPCAHEVLVSVSFPGSSTWRSSLDHQHFTIAPAQSIDVPFEVRRLAVDEPDQSVPALEMQIDYLGASSRVRLPLSENPIAIALTQVPSDYFDVAVNQCLQVSSDDSAIGVAANQIALPDGPMTLEAWVKPIDVTGYQAIIAKTQSSEYALFSDEGVPQFDIDLNGKYVTAKANDVMPLDRWTHVAGMYDGKSVSIFIDGKKVATKLGKGKRRVNELPLYIGADPDGGGRPTRSFKGLIDEVRLSSKAVYEMDFVPQQKFKPDSKTVLLLHLDRTLGPFTLDHSDSAANGLLGPATRLVPSEF